MWTLMAFELWRFDIFDSFSLVQIDQIIWAILTGILIGLL